MQERKRISRADPAILLYEVIKIEKKRKSGVLPGIPVEDPAVPNRAHTEMRLPDRGEEETPSREREEKIASAGEERG